LANNLPHDGAPAGGGLLIAGEYLGALDNSGEEPMGVTTSFCVRRAWTSAPGAVILLGETIFGDGSAALKWRAATPMSAMSQQYFRPGATLVVRPRPLAG
jgi:hypothetical protein